jgi:argininosuccinate synthase
MHRIVLAYSGSAASSAAIPWLIEQHGLEVVTVTLDVGQGVELAHVRERALAAGAVRAHVIDARDEFVRRHVLPALRAGAFAHVAAYDSGRQTRPLVARRVVDLARMEAAAAVAHGCGCDGDARVELEREIRSLDPAIRIVAPRCEWQMSPAEVVEYARTRRIAVADGAASPEANLLGRTLPAASSSHPYTLTRAFEDAPAGAALVELEIQQGTPVRANGVDMPVIEIIESLETIAGAHGVGRVDLGAGRMAESPAAVALHTAFAHLARIDASLSGVVRLQLSKGTCAVLPQTPAVSPFRGDSSPLKGGPDLLERDHQAAV